MDKQTDTKIAVGAVALLLGGPILLFAAWCWLETFDVYPYYEQAVSPYGLRVAQEETGKEPYTHSVYVRYRFLPFGPWSRPIVDDCSDMKLRWNSLSELVVTCTQRPGEYPTLVTGGEPGLRIKLINTVAADVDTVHAPTEATSTHR
ncbi:MAG: hypothetical protein ACREP7_00620 [Lysobacter sp.]